MPGRVLNPYVVSPPSGRETTWEDQYHINLDDYADDDNNNNNIDIFKYVLISTDDKF